MTVLTTPSWKILHGRTWETNPSSTEGCLIFAPPESYWRTVPRTSSMSITTHKLRSSFPLLALTSLGDIRFFHADIDWRWATAFADKNYTEIFWKLRQHAAAVYASTLMQSLPTRETREIFHQEIREFLSISPIPAGAIEEISGLLWKEINRSQALCLVRRPDIHQLFPYLDGETKAFITDLQGMDVPELVDIYHHLAFQNKGLVRSSAPISTDSRDYHDPIGPLGVSITYGGSRTNVCLTEEGQSASHQNPFIGLTPPHLSFQRTEDPEAGEVLGAVVPLMFVHMDGSYMTAAPYIEIPRRGVEGDQNNLYALICLVTGHIYESVDNPVVPSVQTQNGWLNIARSLNRSIESWCQNMNQPPPPAHIYKDADIILQSIRDQKWGKDGGEGNAPAQKFLQLAYRHTPEFARAVKQIITAGPNFRSTLALSALSNSTHMVAPVQEALSQLKAPALDARAIQIRARLNLPQVSLSAWRQRIK